MRSPRRLHLLAIAGLVSSACGSSEREAAAPPPTPVAPAPTQVFPAPPVDPNAQASLLAAAAAAAPAQLAPMGGDPVAMGIRSAATTRAAGMMPEGDMAKGELAEGGHLGFVFPMDPRKCYTIVGFGVGVSDLDLHLLAPPFYNFLVAHDSDAGPNPVIGGGTKPMCPVAPIAIPYKVDIYAKKGGGSIGAQVYSRPK